jgi:hypothetical protein
MFHPGTASAEPGMDGAHDWNRTSDLFLTKEVLYRLSYMSESGVLRWIFNLLELVNPMERETGIEPA